MIPWIIKIVGWFKQKQASSHIYITECINNVHFFLKQYRSCFSKLRPKWHSIVVITVSTVCKYYFKNVFDLKFESEVF